MHGTGFAGILTLMHHAFGIERAGHQVERFQCGLLVREVPTGPDRPPVACVETLNCVGRAQYSPDFDVVVQKRDELLPRVVPQPFDRRVGLAPLLGKLLVTQPGLGGVTAV